MNDVKKKLQECLGAHLKEHEILAAYTTYNIGGPADFFYIARTSEDLVKAVLCAKQLSLPYVVLGGGSNVLVSDRGIGGLVIKNISDTIAIKGMKGVMKGSEGQQYVYLEADSGVRMNKLVRFAIEEGLAGLEMHLGLPGTVGGAVYMNAKWTNPMAWVGDVVYQATILTSQGECMTVGKEYFGFSYGISKLQKNGSILIRVVFCLPKETSETLWARANESIAYRRNTQPQGVRTAGCVFKNISSAEALVSGTPEHTTSAGLLLDAAGCKGLRAGGAEVSAIHANFITTVPGATAKDVIELIGMMKKKVKEKFGVTLKEEIQRLGEF